MSDIELIWDADCRTAESPIWDDRNERVLFSDQRRGIIHSYGVKTGEKKSWPMPESIGSMGMCESGRILVAFHRHVALFDTETEVIEPLTKEIPDPPGNHLNDGKVGPDHCFWVGSKDGRREYGPPIDGNGKIFRVSPDGTMEAKSEGYNSSNGLAWSPDGKTMYFSDTPTGLIRAWDFDASTGNLANERIFVALTAEQGKGDGAATDIDGNYWSAGVRAGCIYRFAPDGELLETIWVPVQGPTMPCFAGDQLFFTSVTRDAGFDGLDRPYNLGGLFRMPAPIAGSPVPRFADQ